MKQAFTLVELIFVIVIIGVLATVAIPKFTKLSDNAKISTELSTASSIQAAIEACHGEWIISDCATVCGKDIDSATEFSANGYPKLGTLGTASNPINRILKNAETSKWTLTGTNQYRGEASSTTNGTSNCKPGKPCNVNKYWEYNEDTGEFKLIEP